MKQQQLVIGNLIAIPPESVPLDTEAVEAMEAAVQTVALQLSDPPKHDLYTKEEHAHTLLTAAVIHRLAMEVRYRTERNGIKRPKSRARETP